MTGNEHKGAELLPCPFCGTGIHMSRDPKSGYFGPDGDHDGKCPINIDFRDYADPKQAATEWNRRASQDQGGGDG